MSRNHRALNCTSLLAGCVAVLSAFAVCSFHPAAEAQVSGISYTLAPVIEGISFNDDAALKSNVLFGGKLGFGFGEFIELNGLYLYGNNLETDFGGLSGFDDVTTALLDALPSRTTDVQQFGGELKFNIGRGSLFPFVTLGSGVVRFDPEGLNHSKAIYLSGGLGLQHTIENRYAFVLQVSTLSYRYNPAASLLSNADIAAVGLTPDDFDRVTVNNLSADVGVKFYVGGWPHGQMTDFDRALLDQLRGGLWAAFRLEPSAGEINSPELLGFRDNQRMLCLSTGIDVGPYAGLRGFYWRGATDDSWTEFDDLQAYGGELKLAFSNLGGGLTPYVTLGGGYMDVMDGYVGNGVAVPEDYPFALGGIGVVMPLGSAVSVDACLRSVLMSTAGVENVASPGDVESSSMFTVGVSFGFGGAARTSGGVFGREMAASKAERDRIASEMTSMEDQLVRLQSNVDSLSALAGREPESRTEPAADLIEVSRSTPSPEVLPDETRWITVPVPEEGEIYLRFGSPGGVSVETIEGEPAVYYFDPATGTIIPASPAPGVTGGAAATVVPGAAPFPGVVTTPPSVTSTPAPAAGLALTSGQIEEIVRRVVREERSPAVTPSPASQPEVSQALEDLPAAAPAPIDRPAPVTDASLRQLETAIDARMRAIETQLAQLREATVAPARPAPEQLAGQPVIVQTPTPSQPTTRVVAPSTRLRPVSEPSVRFVGVAPLTGYNLDEPHQGLVGVRADFIHRERPFRLVPELVMGFGDDEVTTNVNMNGIYELGFAVLDRLYPYGGIGLGLLDREDLELVLNLIVGSDIRIERHTVFLEYLNQDFFDNNRLLAGYRFSF